MMNLEPFPQGDVQALHVHLSYRWQMMSLHATHPPPTTPCL